MRHFIEGNTFAARDQLKELGCSWDSGNRQWYANDRDVAEQARQLVADASTRHHLTGDTHAVKDRLKEMGCRWDADEKRWYAVGRELAAQAQAVIDKGVERHYIDGDCHPAADELKKMGCRYDPKAGGWYHTDREVAAKAQELVGRNNLVTVRYYIDRAPHSMNKELKEMGCRWDAAGRCWYHSDVGVGEKAQRLVQDRLGEQEPGKGREKSGGYSNAAHAIQSAAKEVAHEM